MRRLLALVAICVFFLSSCGENTQSDMFALPYLHETHSALIDTVSELRGEGFEYAETRSGFNREPLQVMDLDGDGEEEGIVLLRDMADSYKTYIYLFEKSNERFSLFDVIEGAENEIYTVSYSDILGNGGYELIVKWGADESASGDITVYALSDEGARKALSITAKQYSVSDMDGDGENELLAVSEIDGHIYAHLYAENNERLKLIGSVHLSEHKGEVIRMLSGKVTPSESGVLIERESEEGVITDVVVLREGKLLNLLPEGDICSVTALCADVNADGVIEIPKTADGGSAVSGTDRAYVWSRLSEDGKLIPSAFTYHSFSENWYLTMPLSWRGSVKTSVGGIRREVKFFTEEKVYGEEEEYIKAPLFSIYVVSKGSAKNFAAEDGRFIIAEREDVAFVAEIASSSYLGEEINEEFIKSAFKNRESDWVSEILFA